jgi:nucleoside-diphosphate-sugar epimerase
VGVGEGGVDRANVRFVGYNCPMSGELVVVTGGSGFVGTHCIVQLLNAGYRVRTTVRSLKREAEVRTMVREGGAKGVEELSFVVADLMADAGWTEAVQGCTYVLHVASPFPAKVPKHEDELIVPAREGTLRVLRNSRDSKVKRVVLTSSFAAIGYGHPPQETPFDETSWTNVDDKNVSAYAKSKTLAERAAWDFIAREAGGLELSVINPVGIFGPTLGADYATSIMLVQRMMDGFPACPKLSVGLVDVRDVAALHLLAMTHSAAKGQRFLAVAGNFISLLEVAKILKTRMGASARRVPTREAPNWLLHVGALFDPSINGILPELGRRKNATNTKAKSVLGWVPRSNDEAVVAAAESLVRLGLLKGSLR